MSIYMDDVDYWVTEWAATGDIIPEAVARKIAEYWQPDGEDGALAAFARGEYVNGADLLWDIAGATSYAKAAGLVNYGLVESVRELYALKDWVLHQEAMGI